MTSLELEARRRLRARSQLSPAVHTFWAALGGIAYGVELHAEMVRVSDERCCRVTQSWRESALRAVPW